ncbi:hypothetical protein JMJ35_003006 [Cladonia borealis]|uniref:Ricin B lectin domain-containing protein n=1 Tax=Cladonia borealis TaxID=184061 RepID=A0AA39R612_9LECA|nr:hypothetical protein JMJ35_003006 [Cladonia borealis]
MSSPLIQSNAYYYVSSDYYGPSVRLGEGDPNYPDAPGILSLTQEGISSKNWQIFYQDSIYLIRNYNYGAKYQLGIAEDSPTPPALLPASGNLTQQWNMTLWDDGTFRLANMWLGNAQILGIGGQDNIPFPVMTAAQNGVSLQAAPSSTSSSLSTSASTTVVSTPAEITVAATTITAGSVSSSSSPVSSQSTTPRSLSGDAIAGIAVAIVAPTLVAFGLLFFLWRRRRRQRHGLPADQAALGQQQEEDWYPATHEADTRHPAVEMRVSNDKEMMRSCAVEMPGLPMDEE